MPLTLDQYADYLDTRKDLNWPAPPAVERPKARPGLVHLPDVRAVTWNIYGTLLAIPGGELYFEHPEKFIMDVALDKTIQEFKMWGAMTRKPGQPSQYMRVIYGNLLSDQRLMPGAPGERHPEIASDRIWEAVLKKLLQNEYTFDAGFYGSLNDFARKVAYFFHASLQGTACYPGAAAALAHVKRALGRQGLLADAQCFTLTQLARGLKAQGRPAGIGDLFADDLRVLSWEFKARRPSERLFKEMLNRLAQLGVEPGQVLHIGSSLEKDIAPARKLGMRAGLFAGDKASLAANAEQLKQPALRPDVMLTELEQITQIVG